MAQALVLQVKHTTELEVRDPLHPIPSNLQRLNDTLLHLDGVQNEFFVCLFLYNTLSAAPFPPHMQTRSHM